MDRERVIVDFENFGQALKLEQTVKTGYCEPIAENLLAWIAVEEDLSNSYSKLSKKFEGQEDLRKAALDLSVESKNNITLLNGLLKSVEEFSEARDRRQKLIEGL